MTPADFLAEAKSALVVGMRSYREARLKAGQYIHLFILEFLKEGDELPHEERMAKEITRSKAVQIASKELGLEKNTITRLLGAWAVSELLGEGNIGELHWQCMHRFAVFLHRGKLTDGSNRIPGLRPSIQEEWAIYPQYVISAKELFRRAVDGNWKHKKTIAEVAKVFKSDTPNAQKRLQHPDQKEKQQRYHKPPSRAFEEVIKTQVAHASPGDVSELCLALIEKSEDPQAVARRLLPELEQLSRKKRKPILSFA